MSSQLFYKLKQASFLPGKKSHFRSLIKYHTRSNNGFSLLAQILRPYLPALKEGISSVVPTWSLCDDDIYLTQAHLTNYYNIEFTLKRPYSEMEQSQKLLQLCQESNVYKEAAIYYGR